MSKFLSGAKRFFNDQEGAAMAEYALILGLIAAAIAALLTTMKGHISDIFTAVNTELDSATP